MSSDKYNVYVAEPQIPRGAYLEALHDDCEGFRIILYSPSQKQRYRVSFDNVFFYLVSDEGKRLRLGQNFMKQESVLYRADKSAFLDWSFAENLEIVPKEKWDHYLICAADEIIEVISSSAPRVKTLP